MALTTAARPSAVTLPSKRLSAAQLEALAARVRTEAPREGMEVEQPFTGGLLGVVPRCAVEDVAPALARARAAQAEWVKTSFEQRRAILLRYHDLILSRQDEVLDLVQLESGKARRHAFEEVLDVAIVSRYYANTAAKHLRSVRRRGALPFLTAAYEHHHPVGVVGIVAPWNYPLTLSVSDAIPALMAGNAVVIKPDGQTPFTALWGFKVLEEAGLPEGLVQVLTGSGAELGPHIIDGSDYVMFTGSTATGRTVAEQAGRNLIGASMELGGKNAMIVLPDANLTRAVDGAERALFSNAGQLCISIERLYVHEFIADEFTRRLQDKVRKMRLGTALDHSVDMGSLISQSQLDTVTAHVEDAVSKGAEVLAGGRARPDIGPYFYEPTLLGRVADGMTLFKDETFGPVVAVSRFRSEEEVVERANDSDYGLNLSLWTRDTRKGRALATRLKAGTVNVNEGYAAAWASVDAPMGGMRASGLGRRHGAEGIRKYTEAQTVAVQKLLPIAPPPRVPQALWGKAMTASLRALKRVPGVK
jgi:succinate-semialdehyde dehydrogenase/glutarate-semialdehyde dehydrogenase